MKAQAIYDLLLKHPYFYSLSEKSRMNVLNLGLSSYKQFVGDVVTHAFYPDGTKGWDGVVLNNGDVTKLPQTELRRLALSSYEELDYNFAEHEYMSKYSEEERRIIYGFAVQAVARAIPEWYQTVNSTGDLVYALIKEMSKPTIGYTVVEKTTKENVFYFPKVNVVYNLTSGLTNSLYPLFPKTLVGYELLTNVYNEEEVFFPKANVVYEISEVAGDPEAIVEIKEVQFPKTNVAYELIQIYDTIENEEMTKFPKANVTYFITETVGDPNITTNKTVSLPKPRVYYTIS